jgi:hypothetical protein
LIDVHDVLSRVTLPITLHVLPTFTGAAAA